MWMTHTNREVYMPLTGILVPRKTGAANKGYEPKEDPVALRHGDEIQVGAVAWIS